MQLKADVWLPTNMGMIMPSYVLKSEVTFTKAKFSWKSEGNAKQEIAFTVTLESLIFHHEQNVGKYSFSITCICINVISKTLDLQNENDAVYQINENEGTSFIK